MKKDFLKTSDVLITEDVSFRDMMLSEQVSAGLTKCNFHKPSPIQLRAIPFGRSGLGMTNFTTDFILLLYLYANKSIVCIF